MTKLFCVGSGKALGTKNKLVEVNQIVQMQGYNYDHYVVYKIHSTAHAYSYKLINLNTYCFVQADIIQPLSEKFGIGYYYDDKEPEFMEPEKVALLIEKANKQLQDEQEAEQKEAEHMEKLKAAGRERLQNLIPDDTQGVIVAKLQEDRSDSQTDYFAYTTTASVILGFSKHKRNLFSEMRKYAQNFEPTKHLAQANEDYEHRENYTGGYGYYLGKSKYNGWIIDKSVRYGSREQLIEGFAHIVGNKDNIRLGQAEPLSPQAPEATDKGGTIIVDYSQKALAVFGNTKPIKEQLKAIGGRFNRQLTYKDEKRAGWIFPKTKEKELRELIL